MRIVNHHSIISARVQRIESIFALSSVTNKENVSRGAHQQGWFVSSSAARALRRKISGENRGAAAEWRGKNLQRRRGAANGALVASLSAAASFNIAIKQRGGGAASRRISSKAASSRGIGDGGENENNIGKVSYDAGK
jgi:hypothetical protein